MLDLYDVAGVFNDVQLMQCRDDLATLKTAAFNSRLFALILLKRHDATELGFNCCRLTSDALTHLWGVQRASIQDFVSVAPSLNQLGIDVMIDDRLEDAITIYWGPANKFYDRIAIKPYQQVFARK